MKKLNKQMNKKNNGITLIALVITIIVLLILAAVSIATLTGQNGILTQAGNAKTKNKTESDIEAIKLAWTVDDMSWNSGDYPDDKDLFLEELRKTDPNSTVDYDSDPDGIIVNYNNDEYFFDPDTGEVFGDTSSGASKTIGELYDGNNDSTTSDYNPNAMHIGDYVDYSAEDDGGDIYSNWRIFDVSDDKKTITLISKRCPAEYSSNNNNYDGFKSEYILTGHKNENDTTNITDGVSSRTWDMYVNKEKNGVTAKALEKGELDNWYTKYIDSETTDIWGATFPDKSENKLVSILDINQDYYLATAYVKSDTYGSNSQTLWACDAQGDVPVFKDGYHVGYNGTYVGIRVLVTLDTDVTFGEIPRKIERDGFSYNKWIIK